jgi:hypothetical protein
VSRHTAGAPVSPRASLVNQDAARGDTLVTGLRSGMRAMVVSMASNIRLSCPYRLGRFLVTPISGGTLPPGGVCALISVNSQEVDGTRPDWRARFQAGR